MLKLFLQDSLVNPVEITNLFKTLEEQDPNNRLEAAEKLGRIGNPEPLSRLRRLWLETEDWHYRSAISAIQNRCQFYNYEIAQGLIPPGKRSHEGGREMP